MDETASTGVVRAEDGDSDGKTGDISHHGAAPTGREGRRLP
jgi:hypothetical protein